MKTIYFLIILIIPFTVNNNLKSQIYTPGGVIQGSTANNFVGIGFTSTSPIAPLTIGRGDNHVGSYNRVCMAFSYNQTGNWRHFITTRHENNRGDYNAIEFYTCDGTENGTFPADAIHGLTISNGKVGIATGEGVNPTYTLDVNGKIRAKEIKVETGWADFVFESNYELMSLTELDNFIKQFGHLPSIPSASEVEKNGISLGEMDAKLLQKIEELTLYVIELNDQLEILKEQNLRLQSKFHEISKNQ